MGVYSFDESSVLHLASVKIPSSCSFAFDKPMLKSRYHDKLHSLLDSIHKKNLVPYRFVPSPNIEHHALSVVNELIAETGVNLGIMKGLDRIFKTEVMDQLTSFHSSLKDWSTIEKAEDFADVKFFFQENERELKKSQNSRYSNIPEDDDCQVLKGLILFQSDKSKVLIAHDEHFWGYKEPIKAKYDIQVVESWNVRRLLGLICPKIIKGPYPENIK